MFSLFPTEKRKDEDYDDDVEETLIEEVTVPCLSSCDVAMFLYNGVIYRPLYIIANMLVCYFWL